MEKLILYGQPDSFVWDLPQSSGRATAQAVSRWLPTAAARVRSGFVQMGFVVEKVALGQVFSVYFNLHSTKFSIIIITRGRLQ
jgi:hypothetical protein